MTIAFHSDPRYVQHDVDPRHPERPDRLRAIHRAVREAGLVASPDPFPEFAMHFGLQSADGPPLMEIAAPGPVDPEWLLQVHDPPYLQRVHQVCQRSGVLDDGDTPVGPGSEAAALLAVGGLLACCDAVVEGRARSAFAAIRPPGHHAEPHRPMGFCLFSNLAIAARYLQRRHGVGRIAIVDFDVHHGNGTQAAFYADPSVLFISLHQHPRTCYPGTGYEHERGAGPGEGYTLNLPLNPHSGDNEYRALFDACVLPALEAYRPEFLLVSAGFDAHRDDPLASIDLSDDAFDWMTRRLVGVAEVHCNGRLVSALEGGYHLHALGRGVVRHLQALAQPSPAEKGS